MEKLSEGRGDKPAEGDYVTVHYVLKTMAGECCMQGPFDHLCHGMHFLCDEC